MGMYTEIILGATLRKDTPKNVIKVLKIMVSKIGENEDTEKEQIANYFPELKGCEHILLSSSSYFGVNESVSKIWEQRSGEYVISTRSSCKQIDEVKTFLKWLEPYIGEGSGENCMYAITMNEESTEPKIYYKYTSN